MAILDIIQPDNPVLRKKAIRVDASQYQSEKFQQLVDDMLDTLAEAHGVGLAAPQVNQSTRLIIVHLPDESEEDREEYGDDAGKTYIVTNPKITKRSRRMVEGVEGCLSIPGILGEVDRHEMIVVTGQDRHGNDFRIKAKGWLARVFQHEIDHLNGQLFIDLTDKIWQVGEAEEADTADTTQDEPVASTAETPATD